jgi:hypothetical protein
LGATGATTTTIAATAVSAATTTSTATSSATTVATTIATFRAAATVGQTPVGITTVGPVGVPIYSLAQLLVLLESEIVVLNGFGKLALAIVARGPRVGCVDVIGIGLKHRRVPNHRVCSPP